MFVWGLELHISDLIVKSIITFTKIEKKRKEKKKTFLLKIESKV
jgi:hypothetical protein